MNKSAFPLAILFLILFFLYSCSDVEQNPGAEADLAAIEEIHRQYRAGANTGDLDLFMSVWADDAIRMESDMNIIKGKEKIREHFRPVFEQFDVTVTIYGDKKIQVEGDVAYSYGNFIISLTPSGGDSASHTDFKYLEIYRRRADGSWKIQIGTATTNPPWSDDVTLQDLLQRVDPTVPKL
jgi:uncharacterized protein (TIGR02246 family)